MQPRPQVCTEVRRLWSRIEPLVRLQNRSWANVRPSAMHDLHDALAGRQGRVSRARRRLLGSMPATRTGGASVTELSNGRVLEGVTIDPNARIEACKLCGKPVWFGLTANG